MWPQLREQLACHFCSLAFSLACVKVCHHVCVEAMVMELLFWCRLARFFWVGFWPEAPVLCTGNFFSHLLGCRLSVPV